MTTDHSIRHNALKNCDTILTRLLTHESETKCHALFFLMLATKPHSHVVSVPDTERKSLDPIATFS